MEKETKVVRSRGRPRKRRRPEEEDAKSNSQNKRVSAETRSIALVGRYVLKEFQDNGVFLGKVVFYETGLYRVEYEDGDREDLDSSELRGLVLDDAYFDDDLIERKKKLNELLLEKSSKEILESDLEKKVEDTKIVDGIAVPTPSDLSDALPVENGGDQVEEDESSSSDSDEHVYDRDASTEAEAPTIPPPELPSSSGTIGVPEDCVSHLFSVYGFLRSFSIQLFLSPFGLDDFVGALNCSAPNTLLDAVHVVLLRALRHHLEAVSSEGSDQASKCLRSLDWSLLDALTWPVYLVQYFIVMGYIKGPGWQKNCEDVSRAEYYSIPVSRKLMNLQFLCDDVLDSMELRAEIDMREESEVGLDPDAAPTVNIQNGPRRVHPRFSKTSACKEKEVIGIISEGHELKASSKSKYVGLKGTEGSAYAVDANMDTNSDECRLCGMDGTLLCCDGCPSAYHSRCIGVSKMHIPDGSWYCPECTIDKLGPAIAEGTSLRGAEVFGIDLHGNVFLGTCNHLLVLKSSTNLDSYLRYYNLNDIPKALKVLLSLIHQAQPYLGICKAIMKYWNLPDSISFPVETIEMGKNTETVEKDAKPALSYLPPGDGSYRVPVSVDAVIPSSFPIIYSKLSEQSNFDSALTVSSVGPSDATYQGSFGRSTVSALTTNVLGNNPGRLNDGNNYEGNGSCQSTADKHALFRSDFKGSVTSSAAAFMGLSYKPQAYINHYNHGEVAAAAAAKLSVLSSEESQGADVNKSGGRRKATSSDISLQAKAFSSIALRFFWPSAERKFVEAVRERCGWCHSCKAITSSKRGCMLNAAVSGAIKSAREIINGLPTIKNKDGSLSSIAAYILYMEVSLRGLVVGPFLNPSYRQQWCKKVEEASTLRAIKACLLELEKNISVIALSAEWVKPIDDWMTETTMIVSTSSSSGVHKRGPGRRPKRHPSTSEVTPDDSDGQIIIWWRGGKLSKYIFQKAVLPCSMVKRTAKKGGGAKISGISYVDGSDILKRNRQLLWRAAVERSMNISQLALQVRYLDLHVRWNDLVRPEQNLQDGKGAETEAAVFRNATACDKKAAENKILYGIVFGNQKHLPSRVMKNIINIEQIGEGKEKYWFHETRIPLYLIKEYEEKVGKALLPSEEKPPARKLSDLQKRQLKASRRNIFLYLSSRRDKLENCSCASCRSDVLLRDAVTCSSCRGYCHKDCTSSSSYLNGKVEHFIMCMLCCHAQGFARKDTSNRSPFAQKDISNQSPFAQKLQSYKSPFAQNDISNKSPTTPLFVHGRQVHSTPAVAKSAPVKVSFLPPKPPASVVSAGSSIKTKENRSEVKHRASAASMAEKPRKKICHWGIIWRKRNSEETGIEFRRANLLIKGGSDNQLVKPVCHLCQQPYNLELMYVHCETCTKWYHADAVELTESRIFELVGFKCCKCRRIKGPECPYTATVRRDEKRRKALTKEMKQGPEPVDFDLDSSGTSFEAEECNFTIPLVPTGENPTPVDDPLEFSHSKVEFMTENTSDADLEWNSASGFGPQKLPVRRQVKQEGDEDGIGRFHAELPESFEPNYDMEPKEEQSVPIVQWDVHGKKLPVRRQMKREGDEDNINHFQAELSESFEPNYDMKPEELSLPVAQWDNSGNGPEGNLLLDYDSLTYEDMEFEPQTYFSFNELLDTDVGGEIDGNAAGGTSRKWETPLSQPLQDDITELCQDSAFTNQVEPFASFETDPNELQCRVCLHKDPTPDLLCMSCGFLIHSYCSPWNESQPLDGSWSCGRCRDWH